MLLPHVTKLRVILVILVISMLTTKFPVANSIKHVNLAILIHQTVLVIIVSILNLAQDQLIPVNKLKLMILGMFQAPVFLELHHALLLRPLELKIN